MFSNSRIKKKSIQTNKPDEVLRSNENVELSPSSPNTRHLSLAINSYKSFGSGNLNTNNNQPSSKLFQLIQPETQLGLESRVITLVSSNQGVLHFHDESANVLQRYPNNDIAFVGVWGASTSDMTFFCNKLLNLFDIAGDKYSINMKSNSSELCFFERAFVKDKIRFFLVASKGYKNGKNLTKLQQNSLDSLMSICQVIILMEDSSNTRQDIIEIGYEHFSESFNRLYVEKNNRQKKQDLGQICWPKSLFIIHTIGSSIKKHKKSAQKQQQLCKMFEDYNFSILHNKNLNQQNISSHQQQLKSYTSINNPLDQLYLKNVSIIFRQIYSKIQAKDFLNVKFNGYSFPHILTELTYAFNQHDHVYLPKIFSKAKRNIFSSIYNRYTVVYLLKLKQYLPSQKPYNTDYLLQSFQTVSEQTIGQFYQTYNDVSVKPFQDSICIQYEKKLQQFMEQKQKNILNVNKKKSAKQLQNLINEDTNPIDELKKVQKSILGQSRRSFDINAESDFVATSIKKVFARKMKSNGRSSQKKVQKIKQVVQEEEQPYQQYEEQLKRKKQLVAMKKQELEKKAKEQIQSTEANKQYEKLKQQQKLLQKQMKQQQQRIKDLQEQVRLSQIHSNISQNSEEGLLLDEKKREVQKFKMKIEQKYSQKKKLEEDLKNVVKVPQIQVLKSKVIEKKGELESVKKSVAQADSKIPIILQTQRRQITSNNIRRVQASKI